MIRTALALFLCLLAGLAAQAAAQEPGPRQLRILFIGDELTSANDLPGRLARVAEATGRKAIVEAVVRDDYTLEDHWKRKTAEEALRREWDVVVLQQGPSERPAERAQLVESSKRFAEAIRAAGARPALYMVWPASHRRRDFPAVIESYRAAADASGAMMLPAGEAWVRLMSQDHRSDLYRDRLNPTKMGTDLALLTIYFSLFPAGPQEFDEAFVARIAATLEIPAKSRDQLFDAATRAVDSPLPIR
jgi:hypothetical protein